MSSGTARAGAFPFIEVEYNHTRPLEHPVHGYATPLETRTMTTQDLAPAA
ncbi:hypothetical protein ABZ892_33060 [Streptomyces sp. NPDC046924]